MRNIFSTPKSPSPPHRTTFSSSIMDENMESASSIIMKWNTDSLAQAKSSPLFSGDRTESKLFLKSIEELHFGIKYFISENYSSDKLAHGQNLMQLAMKRLEKEFYIILSAQRDFLDSESSVKSSVSSYNSENESQFDESLVSDETIENQFEKSMADLKLIADCMITYGYGKECAKIYNLVRKSVVDEKLYYLGVENVSFCQIQKLDWEIVELKIKQWVNAMKVAIRSLFRGERILCDHVLAAASDTIKESCFAEMSISGGLMLLSFPEMIAKCKKSPEKIFKLLDLYDAISQHWEDIASIFSFDSTSTVRLQAHSSLSKLGDAIRITLSEFESAIQKHTSKSLLPGGGVHPLTRYVMNYFIFMVDYSSILPEIIGEDPVTTTASVWMPESYFSTSSAQEISPSAISLRFAWIILVLLCKLDGNAQLYKDVSLSYLFLANNLNYIVSKVRNSNLKVLLGDEWLVKHQSKVQQYASNYQRMSWSKLISSVPNNPALDISPEEAKKCFLLFNSIFEDSYRKQSSWIVTDPKLQDQIKTSVANQVVPVYTEFYENNRQFFTREVGVESIVRYAPQDLQNYLSDLFSGIGLGESTSSYSSVAESPARERRKNLLVGN